MSGISHNPLCLCKSCLLSQHLLHTFIEVCVVEAEGLCLDNKLTHVTTLEMLSGLSLVLFALCISACILYLKLIISHHT